MSYCYNLKRRQEREGGSKPTGLCITDKKSSTETKDDIIDPVKPSPVDCSQGVDDSVMNVKFQKKYSTVKKECLYF